MPPQQQPKMTGGPIHAVVCPYCGRPNDFRELELQDGSMIYRGAEIICDHCHGVSEVTMKRPVTFIQLRPIGKRAAPVAGPAPARTISQAQARRLLR